MLYAIYDTCMFIYAYNVYVSEIKQINNNKKMKVAIHSITEKEMNKCTRGIHFYTYTRAVQI